MTRGHKLWLLFLGLAIAASAVAWPFVIGSWHLPEARKQIAESVARQPTNFTELYFTEPSKLPKALAMGPNAFSFTVANHEGKAIDYRYQVTVQTISGTLVVADGVVSVGAGAAAKTSVKFTPDQAATTYLVTVQLVGRAEVIHFAGQT